MCFKNIILIAELEDSGELTFTETLKMCLVISSTKKLLKLFPICCAENETEIHSTPHATLNQAAIQFPVPGYAIQFY